MKERKKKKIVDQEEPGVRHKKSKDITCQFCMAYINIPSEYRDKVTRYCKTGSRQIMADSEACDEFDLCRTFRCYRLDFDSCPPICLNRIIKGVLECRGCKEGLMLYRFLAVPPPVFNIIGGDDHATSSH